jgi:hypothetical protein
MFEFSFLFVIVCCSAQEVIKPLMSNSADVYFVGNAPSGHLHYYFVCPHWFCFAEYESSSRTSAHVSLLNLVVRTIQKLPKFAEAKSRQLIPYSLAVVGQADNNRL